MREGGTEHCKMLRNNKRQQMMQIPLAVTWQHGTVYFLSSERPELNPTEARSICISISIIIQEIILLGSCLSEKQ